MATTTVRVSAETHAVLQQLAGERHATIQQVLAEAVEAYRRQRLIDATNAAYAALREDPAAWRDVEQERAAWDAALSDGLEGS